MAKIKKFKEEAFYRTIKPELRQPVKEIVEMMKESRKLSEEIFDLIPPRRPKSKALPRVMYRDTTRDITAVYALADTEEEADAVIERAVAFDVEHGLDGRSYWFEGAQ